MNPTIAFPLSPAAGIGLAILTLYGVRWLPVVVLAVYTLYLAIARTAFARPEHRAKALAAGYDLYLVKPLRPGVLMQASKNVKMGGHPT